MLRTTEYFCLVVPSKGKSRVNFQHSVKAVEDFCIALAQTAQHIVLVIPSKGKPCVNLECPIEAGKCGENDSSTENGGWKYEKEETLHG